MDENRVRAITVDTNDHYISKHHGMLKGILVDAWNQITKDLGIANDLDLRETNEAAFDEIRSKKADILIQRINEQEMEDKNIAFSE